MRIVAFLAVLSVAAPVVGAPLVRWLNTYGEWTEDIAYAACLIPLDGLLVAGSYTTHAGFQQLDLRVAAIDSSGGLMWIRRYGDLDHDEFALAIASDSIGGFLVVGQRFLVDSPETSRMWLVRCDANGDTIWTQDVAINTWSYQPETSVVYHGSSWDIYFSRYMESEFDFKRVMTVSDSGDSLRSAVFDSTDRVSICEILPMENGYLSVGSQFSSIRLARSNSLYQPVWSRSVDLWDGHACSVNLGLDKTIAIAGYSVEQDSMYYDPFVMAFDSTGDSLWMTFVEVPYFSLLIDVLGSLDSGIVALGTQSYSEFSLISDIRLTKFSRSGEILWSELYGDSLYVENPKFIFPTADGGYYVVGTTLLRTGNWPDFFVLRTEADVIVRADGRQRSATTFTLHPAYPNPFNSSTVISFEIPQTAFVSLRVFDVTGRLVATPLAEVMQGGTHAVSFDAHSLASGVYFCRMEAGEYRKTQKMVLIK